MTDFEGLPQILLFEVLFEDTCVEVVVHVLVEPGQGAFLDGFES